MSLVALRAYTASNETAAEVHSRRRLSVRTNHVTDTASGADDDRERGSGVTP
jgi:hypothetical protein